VTEAEQGAETPEVLDARKAWEDAEAVLAAMRPGEPGWVRAELQAKRARFELSDLIEEVQTACG